MLTRITQLACLAGALAFIAGCASIVHGDNQPIGVAAYSGSAIVKGATCTITNDEGTWYVTSPGSATVTRSAEALSVLCEMEGHDPGMATVESSVKVMAFGNILFGGVIGAAVDAGTGAAFDYPVTIRVQMGEESIIGHEAPKEE